MASVYFPIDDKHVNVSNTIELGRVLTEELPQGERLNHLRLESTNYKVFRNGPDLVRIEVLLEGMVFAVLDPHGIKFCPVDDGGEFDQQLERTLRETVGDEAFPSQTPPQDKPPKYPTDPLMLVTSRFLPMEIIFNDGHFVIAVGQWERDKLGVGCRWHDPKGERVGYPNGFGHPQWMNLPVGVGDILRSVGGADHEQLSLIFRNKKK